MEVIKKGQGTFTFILCKKVACPPFFICSLFLWFCRGTMNCALPVLLYFVFSWAYAIRPYIFHNLVFVLLFGHDAIVQTANSRQARRLSYVKQWILTLFHTSFIVFYFCFSLLDIICYILSILYTKCCQLVYYVNYILIYYVICGIFWIEQ